MYTWYLQEQWKSERKNQRLHRIEDILIAETEINPVAEKNKGFTTKRKKRKL